MAFMYLIAAIALGSVSPLFISRVHAAPAAIDVEARQSPTAISQAQINSYTPYTWYSATAYCSPSETLKWNCGSDCKGNSDFQPYASGGDGAFVQYWYVGYDPSLNTVIVAHQGTNPFLVIPDITDADVFLEPMDSTLFPGVPSGVQVHSGFAGEQSDTASVILSSVKAVLAKHPGASVTTTGHSLGAAISLLDALYLKLNLPSGTALKTVVYGLPRVGNPAFANYVDSLLTDLTHITNQLDPVPAVPETWLGYRHPSGEVHIEFPTGTWYACPGQENGSIYCEDGQVPTIITSNLFYHLGPYNGIYMGECDL